MQRRDLLLPLPPRMSSKQSTSSSLLQVAPTPCAGGFDFQSLIGMFSAARGTSAQPELTNTLC
jgi:hypothetical protein